MDDDEARFYRFGAGDRRDAEENRWEELAGNAGWVWMDDGYWREADAQPSSSGIRLWLRADTAHAACLFDGLI